MGNSHLTDAGLYINIGKRPCWLVYTRDYTAEEEVRIRAALMLMNEDIKYFDPDTADAISDAEDMLLGHYGLENLEASMAAYSMYTIYHAGPVTRLN